MFADKTTFALGESGQMRLDELVYNPAGKDGKIALSVLKGAFAFVSGDIAGNQTDAMTVRDPGRHDRHSRHRGDRQCRPERRQHVQRGARSVGRAQHRLFHQRRRHAGPDREFLDHGANLLHRAKPAVREPGGRC
ncbi:MAG: hypothetical protein WDO24_12150 [Pseudomonadota bacterium]